MQKNSSLLIASALLTCSSALAHEFSGAHGTVAVDWSAPNISRVISSGYGDSFGMEAWARMGFPEPVEVDGRQCIDGSYFLFDVDDDFAFDIDEAVTIEFLFDRTRSSGFWISYDRNVISEPLAGSCIRRFRRAVANANGNTGTRAICQSRRVGK